MPDYIKREDALKIFSTSKENWKDYEAAACIAAIPAADAVEVVRCKDCKHWRQSSIEKSLGLCVFGRLNVRANAYDTFFCADGERRNHDATD